MNNLYIQIFQLMLNIKGEQKKKQPNRQRYSIQPFIYDDEIQNHIGKRSGKFIGEINPDLHFDGYARFSDILTLNSIAVNRIQQSSEQPSNGALQSIFNKVMKKSLQQLPDFGLISSIKKKQIPPTPRQKRQKQQNLEEFLEPTSNQQDNNSDKSPNKQNIKSNSQNNVPGFSHFQFVENQIQNSAVQDDSSVQILLKLNKKFQQKQLKENHRQCKQKDNAQNLNKQNQRNYEKHTRKSNIILNKKEKTKESQNNNDKKTRQSIKFLEDPIQVIHYNQNSSQEIGIQKIFKKRISDKIDKEHQNINHQFQKMILDESHQQQFNQQYKNQKIQKKILKQIVHQFGEPQIQDLQNDNKPNPKQQITFQKQLNINEDHNNNQKQGQKEIKIRRLKKVNSEKHQDKISKNTKQKKQIAKQKKRNLQRQEFIPINTLEQEDNKTQQTRYPKRTRIPTLMYWCQRRQKQHGKFIGITTKIADRWVKKQIQFQKKGEQNNTQDYYKNISIYKILGLKQNSIKISQQENKSNKKFKYYKINLKAKSTIESKNPNYKQINFQLLQGQSTKVSIFHDQNQQFFSENELIGLSLCTKFKLKNNSSSKNAILLLKILL